MLSPEEVQRKEDAEEERQIMIIAFGVLAPIAFVFLLGLAIGIAFF